MKTTLLPVLVLSAALAACGGGEPEETQAPAAGVTPEPAAANAPARTQSAADARVFFISPQDGDTLSNPIRVVFGIEGMSVAPAGTDAPHSGHHHLLIDTGLPDLGLPIPADAHHVHFGDGRAETEITLEPGEHTLQMLLGDHTHIPHDPPLYSDVISVSVE